MVIPAGRHRSEPNRVDTLPVEVEPVGVVVVGGDACLVQEAAVDPALNDDLLCAIPRGGDISTLDK